MTSILSTYIHVDSHKAETFPLSNMYKQLVALCIKYCHVLHFTLSYIPDPPILLHANLKTDLTHLRYAIVIKTKTKRMKQQQTIKHKNKKTKTKANKQKNKQTNKHARNIQKQIIRKKNNKSRGSKDTQSRKSAHITKFNCNNCNNFDKFIQTYKANVNNYVICSRLIHLKSVRRISYDFCLSKEYLFINLPIK